MEHDRAVREGLNQVRVVHGVTRDEDPVIQHQPVADERLLPVLGRIRDVVGPEDGEVEFSELDLEDLTWGVGLPDRTLDVAVVDEAQVS